MSRVTIKHVCACSEICRVIPRVVHSRYVRLCDFQMDMGTDCCLCRAMNLISILLTFKKVFQRKSPKALFVSGRLSACIYQKAGKCSREMGLNFELNEWP